jgi:MFS superfamily sulfate permease-like transporter
VRVDENLYFANVGHVQDMITREFQKRPGIKHLVLVMSGVGFVDSSALKVLQVSVESLREGRRHDAPRGRQGAGDGPAAPHQDLRADRAGAGLPDAAGGGHGIDAAPRPARKS